MIQYDADGLEPLAQLKREFFGDIVQMCCAGSHPVGRWELLLEKVALVRMTCGSPRFLLEPADSSRRRIIWPSFKVEFRGYDVAALGAIIYQKLGQVEEEEITWKARLAGEYGNMERAALSGQHGIVAALAGRGVTCLPLSFSREAEQLIEGNDVGFPANPIARP